MKHQQRALDLMGIDWTKNPEDDYDILHLNTYMALAVGKC